MDAVLEARGASVRFPVRRGIFARTKGWIHAVEGVDLRLGRGETVGIAGESGCGKTTLGRALTGLEELSEGEVLWGGRRVFAAGHSPRVPKEERRKVQMVFQDPQGSLNPRMTVCDLVTEGLAEHGLLRGEGREAAARRLLGEVGLGAEALWRYPFEFSGGQRQRICIARAMALEPEAVVCDEVASALDVSVQAQVINLLTDLQERRGVAYVSIGHDLGVLRHMSDRILVMYLGRVVEEGDAEAVTGAPLHPYTQALTAAVPRAGGARGGRKALQGEPPSALHPPAGCAFHPRCPLACGRCRAEAPELADVGGGRKVRCWRVQEGGAA